MSRRFKVARLTAAAAGVLLLAACEEGASGLRQAEGGSAVEASSQTKLVERDVEAPDVFQVTEAGLWDGRPSIGGVWVAHPDVKDPERVIIRNNANGKFVIGALFRRERSIPGPRLQVSSDAAAALGMLAGAPVELNATALRRETVADEPELEEAAEVSVSTLDAQAPVTKAESSDALAGAAAAIEAAAPAPAPKPAPRPKARTGAVSKPYVQIGIFSVEANAERVADQMRNAGMIPTVLEQSANGKPFWRVLIGPAQSKSEPEQLLKKVKDAGFSDAYAVTN